jgi:hypothetical protein
VYAEQLSELEYRRRLGALRYGLPFSESRWGVVALLYGPLLLASGGLAATAAWTCIREPDGWGRFWPVLAVFSPMVVATGCGLVRAVCGR